MCVGSHRAKYAALESSSVRILFPGIRKGTFSKRGSCVTIRPSTPLSGCSNRHETFSAGRRPRLTSSRWNSPASNTTSRTTSPPGRGLSRSSGCDELKSFVGELEGLDRDLVVARVERRPLPLAGPGLDDVPAQHLLVSFVEKHDRGRATIGLALDDVPVPVPELEVLRHPSLQRDIRVLGEPRQLARPSEHLAAAVLDDCGLGSEPAHLAEGGNGHRVDLHTEVEVPVRICATAHPLSFDSCERSPP